MILVKYPTRSRPDKFKINLERYINISSLNLCFIISMDADDSSMNNEAIKTYLNSKNSDRIKIEYFYGESKGKINAINRDITAEEWDILIATADDMEPYPNWDQIIVDDFKGAYFRALNYNTDPRVEDFKTLITLPVIGRQLYDHFGYIYHPAYRSEFCDNEQTAVFERMGVLIHIDKRVIIHKWHENQDSLMRRNIIDGYSDRAVFEQRKNAGFPK
jgi:hypothetical protein